MNARRKRRRDLDRWREANRQYRGVSPLAEALDAIRWIAASVVSGIHAFRRWRLMFAEAVMRDLQSAAPR